VAISISDAGRGVPPDLLPHLFRKHVRVGEDRGIRGSGLGLAICKGLVEAHAGRIWAESAGSGLGTRFTFTIPVAEEAGIGAAPGIARSSSRSPRTDRKETRILVVDDDPRTLRFVQDALAAAGYSPLATGDARDVSRLILEKKPRLVLLDLVLPGTDGIGLMRDVPELADMPVVFISGYGRDEAIATALEKGATDYIVKPFTATELTARVKAALRRWYGSSDSFRLGDLAIRYEARQVSVAGRPVQLTATEFELLRVLAVNAGRIMTYDSLLRQVWGQGESGDRRVVHAVMRRLRQKLGDDAMSPSYIFTERHVGYRMPNPMEP
jgi:two-component system KDP operon response regulator KdpE